MGVYLPPKRAFCVALWRHRPLNAVHTRATLRRYHMILRTFLEKLNRRPTAHTPLGHHLRQHTTSGDAPVSTMHRVHRVLQAENNEEEQLDDLRHPGVAGGARWRRLSPGTVVVAHGYGAFDDGCWVCLRWGRGRVVTRLPLLCVRRCSSSSLVALRIRRRREGGGYGTEGHRHPDHNQRRCHTTRRARSFYGSRRASPPPPVSSNGCRLCSGSLI